jgi:PEP-CTERM motif
VISKKFRKLAVATAFAAVAMSSTPASALTINLFNLNNVTPGTDAFRGFRAAANFWERVITTNSTVNLNVGFSALGPNILGSTGSTTNGAFLQPFVQQLQSRSSSNLDRIATANAQSFKPSVDGAGLGAYNFLISGPKANGTGVQTAPLTTVFDNDGSRNNNSLSVNTSVLKALGIAPVYTGANLANQIDGTVQFSNQFAFDFNPTNGIDANAFDFVAIAIHEIGHALGFRSGVDVYDGNTNFTGNLNNFTFLTQLDLFRYTAASAALGANDVQIGSPAYFSIDGGRTLFQEGLFSTGVRFGDGRQAAHFKDAPAGAPQLGLLDPTIARGQQGIITSLDLAAFDAIGYSIAYDVIRNGNREFTTLNPFFGAIPEPETWAMMIMGFGFVGGAMRRRSGSTKVTYA